ncbi:MAG: TetR-like C-terminal domain-containing protein [Microbacteriaceae bacterium]
MARAGLTRESVVDIALKLIDADGTAGFGSITLSAVAGRAGVAVPSLYKHVASLGDLKQAMRVAAVRELTRVSAEAVMGRSGDDAVTALAHAMRGFARQHPARYWAVQTGGGLADDQEFQDAAAETLRVVEGALRGYALPADRLVDAIRALRSAMHGFVMLELGGGFGLPDDLDDSFDVLIRLLTRGLSTVSD